jgi:hypothetical protein
MHHRPPLAVVGIARSKAPVSTFLGTLMHDMSLEIPWLEDSLNGDLRRDVPGNQPLLRHLDRRCSTGVLKE